MKKTKGFTLAEILITLAIIGVVAAITLPSLLVNVNEKAWDAQRKALHARMAQAIGQMNTLGGYGTFETDEEGTATVDTAAESFILDALSKVYKINNVCGADKLSSCGVPSKIATLGGEAEINFPTKMSELNSVLLNGASTNVYEGKTLDTKAAAFETINGESVAVFYNSACGSEGSQKGYYVQNKMCVNFLYDLNGSEGPNQVGKDVGFITALYRTNPVVVAPLPYIKNANSAPSYSGNEETLDAASSCKMQGEDLRLPNKEEIASLFINSPLVNMEEEKAAFWSGSIISLGETGYAWRQLFSVGGLARELRSNIYSVRCIYK